MLQRPVQVKTGGLWHNFRPDYIAKSILDIDFEYLAHQGIKAALIDLDGTVVARGTYEVDEQIRNVLQRQPLRIYIATNRPKSRGLKNLKEQLNATGVIHPTGIWGKPFPRYYAQAVTEHKLRPEEVVMIGDRYIQDIYGAKTAGLRTLLVTKLDTPTNLVDTILSNIEGKRTQKLRSRYKALE